MEQIEYDKTKYFMDANKNKIYVPKGGGHKGLAYNILRDIGLNYLYNYYEDILPVTVFLTYCGYVLVDEGEEKYEESWDDDFKTTKFTVVLYCSAAIDENYIKYIKDTYDSKENIIEDSYSERYIKKDKIDEIMKRIETVRIQIEKQIDDDAR